MCAAVYRLRHLVKATEVTAGLAESNGSLLPESDVCCRLQVAPSGESYGGNRRPGRK